MSKVTIYDIAKAMNVTASTVNRAINGKPGVGEQKRQQILDYAKKAGYKVNQAAKSMNRTLKFAFVSRQTIGVFDRQIIEGVKAAHSELEGYNVSLDIHTAKTSREYLGIMTNLKESDYSAVITPPVLSEGINDVCAGLMDAGIPVATVVSDVDPDCRLFSVHLNGFIAGSTAAELLHLSGCSRAAYFCGNPDVTIHREMIDGFQHFSEAHGIHIASIYNDNADPETACENCRRMLADHSDIQGVFVGTANSVPICEEIVASKRDIRIISMDVFREITAYIKRGVISASLYQQPMGQGYKAVRSMYRYLQENTTPADVIIQPEIVLQSNVGQYKDYFNGGNRDGE